MKKLGKKLTGSQVTLEAYTCGVCYACGCKCLEVTSHASTSRGTNNANASRQF